MGAPKIGGGQERAWGGGLKIRSPGGGGGDHKRDAQRTHQGETQSQPSRQKNEKKDTKTKGTGALTLEANGRKKDLAMEANIQVVVGVGRKGQVERGERGVPRGNRGGGGGWQGSIGPRGSVHKNGRKKKKGGRLGKRERTGGETDRAGTGCYDGTHRQVRSLDRSSFRIEKIKRKKGGEGPNLCETRGMGKAKRDGNSVPHQARSTSRD